MIKCYQLEIAGSTGTMTVVMPYFIEYSVYSPAIEHPIPQWSLLDQRSPFKPLDAAKKMQMNS